MIDLKNSIQKHILFSCITICMCYSSQALAQNTNTNSGANSTPNLDSVLIPFSSSEAADSAAFGILGIPRSDVALPSSNPTKFGLTLLESISNSNGDFLGNFGFEIAPYYWFDNTLGFQDYLQMNKFGQPILPTLSFSIATTDIEIPEEGDMVDSTRLGIGLRTKLLSGQPSSRINDLVNKYKEVSQECVNEINNRPGSLFETDEDGNFVNDFPPDGTIAFTKDCANAATRRDELGEEIRNLATDLRGLEIAIAAGGAFDVPGDDWGEIEFSRVSGSLTVGFRPTITVTNKKTKTESQEPSSFQFLGVTRYIYNDFNDSEESVFDLGTKILWQIEQPLIVSAEYLHRFGEEDDDRIVGIFEYRFNEKYSLFASFGKNFDDDTSFAGDGDLVTLFGINFGLGQNFLKFSQPESN